MSSSLEARHAAIKMRNEGTSFSSIGRRLGVSTTRAKVFAQTDADSFRKLANLRAQKSRVDEAVKLVTNGASYAEAARSCRVYPDLVRYRFASKGIKAKPKDSSARDALYSKAISMVREGSSYSKAVVATGLGREALIKRCKRAGVISKFTRKRKNWNGYRRYEISCDVAASITLLPYSYEE